MHSRVWLSGTGLHNSASHNTHEHCTRKFALVLPKSKILLICTLSIWLAIAWHCTQTHPRSMRSLVHADVRARTHTEGPPGPHQLENITRALPRQPRNLRSHHGGCSLHPIRFFNFISEQSIHSLLPKRSPSPVHSHKGMEPPKPDRLSPLSKLKGKGGGVVAVR